MAPQIGAKDAPTIVKNPIRFSATPVTARRIATVTPTIIDEIRLTPGIIVEKLFPAIRAQKHAGGTDAIANRKNIEVARKPPRDAMTASKLNEVMLGFIARAAATDKIGSPPAYRMAIAIPVRPPNLTSRSSRL